MCAAQRPLQETSDLIGEIYDAALDPSCWQVVLQHLVDGFDCTSALIRILDPDHAKVDFSFTCGFTTHCLRAYAEHFVRVDPFVQALNRKPIGHIGVSQEVLSDRELQRTEYFNDYMRPHGRFHLAGGYVVREQGRVVQFALQRERRAGAFDEEELRVLRMLTPHIRRSFHIGRQMRQQATADRDLEQALDRLATAVIIVTVGLRVVFMNRAAAHLVDRCSAVTVLNNRLVFSDAAFATRLKTLTRRDSGAAATRSIEGLRVIAAPLPPAAAERGLGDAGADALLFLAGPDTPRAPDSRLLRDLYGLSVAECRLAQELIGGASLDQVRERFRLSRNTVKTQLKSVFRKTGARSQGDLMRLFLSGPEADLFVAGRSPAPDSIE